jgi:hypothetical protein
VLPLRRRKRRERRRRRMCEGFVLLYMYIFSCTSSGIGFSNVQSSLLRCLGPQLQLSTVLLHDGRVTVATSQRQPTLAETTTSMKHIHTSRRYTMQTRCHVCRCHSCIRPFPTPLLGTHSLKGELCFES